MPDDLEIVGVVTVGHAGARAEPGSTQATFARAKPLEEVVRWERW